VDLWHRGGRSVRAIAAEVGCTRRAAEKVVKGAAEELYSGASSPTSFAERFEESRRRRMESISESVRELEAELCTLREKRRLYAKEASYTKEYTGLTSLIMQAMRALDDLRAAYAEVEAEAPPEEVLALEVRAVRKSMGLPGEEGE